MKAILLVLLIAFGIAATVVQCSTADECRKAGGIPVRGAGRAVECIPGGTR